VLVMKLIFFEEDLGREVGHLEEEDDENDSEG
jgi:hypothetical protein